MDITLKPVAFVKNRRNELKDDFWGDVISEIILAEDIPGESFHGIEDFSHVEIIFQFHLAHNEILYKRHPRGNKSRPEVGIFAQRNKDRPNSLGLTVARLLKHEGRSITVCDLDAINGTPVLDIKPVMKQFNTNPLTVKQPDWVDEMLKDYWKK